MTIGFFGNLTVIVTVLTVKELKIVVNLLLVAMALSDLVITIALPFTFLHNISYNFEAPVWICTLTPFIQGTAIMSGIYTLVLIAVERYNAIVNPHRQRIVNSPSRVAMCVGMIWVFSACFQIPLAVVLDVVSADALLSSTLQHVEDCEDVCFNVSLRQCIETWSSTQALGFSYAVLVTFYIVPLSCLIFLYSRMGYSLWKRRPIGAASKREINSYTRKKRLITFLVVLVVTFAVMWGPYFILQCIIESITKPIIPGFVQIMGHANVAVNPILYASFHRKIRKHALAYMNKATSFCRLSSKTKRMKREIKLPDQKDKDESQKGMRRRPRTSMQFTNQAIEMSFSEKKSSYSYDELVLRISDLRRQSETIATELHVVGNSSTHHERPKTELTWNNATPEKPDITSRPTQESSCVHLPNTIEESRENDNSSNERE